MEASTDILLVVLITILSILSITMLAVIVSLGIILRRLVKKIDAAATVSKESLELVKKRLMGSLGIFGLLKMIIKR